jgi:hypothetical protein
MVPVNTKGVRRKVGIGKGWYQVFTIQAETYEASKPRYSYQKKQATRFELNSELAHRFGAYDSMIEDMSMILEFVSQIKKLIDAAELDQLDDQSHLSTIQGLFIAALSVYGRCFNKAVGRKITLRESYFKEAEIELGIHRKLMKLRNNYAAHWGEIDEIAKLESTTVLLTARHIGKRIFTISTEHKAPMFGLLNEIERNCHYLKKNLTVTRERQYNKLIKSEPQVLKVLFNRIYRVLTEKAKLSYLDAIEILSEHAKYRSTESPDTQVSINGPNEIGLISPRAKDVKVDILHAIKKDTWCFTYGAFNWPEVH